MNRSTHSKKANGVMRYWLLSFMVLLGMAGNANAQLTNVPVTGFNADEVANGVGNPTGSTTAAVDLGVDNGGYVFIDGTYLFNSSCTPATSAILPANNLITSVAAPGLIYTLQPYNGLNSLRVPATGVAASTGTLTLVTPTAMANLYLLCIAGGGAITSGVTVTVNFTDATSQTLLTNGTASDWCSGASSGATTLIPGSYNRIQATSLTLTCGSASPCQYLYEMSLPLSGANYSKLVSSITISKTTSTNVFNIFSVGMKAPCAAPSSQPTAMVQGATTTSAIAGSFTAAAGSPAGYVVVRYPTGSIPTNPINGTTYTAGTLLGSGIVVSAASGTTFNATGLTGGTTYDFYVYSYNSGTTCGGPIYLTTSPLTASFTTSTCSGLAAGTYSVGPTGTYATITAALAATTAGIAGPVVFELQSTYTSAGETFPITFPFNSCINASNPVTIRPAAGATGLTIANSAASANFDFNGARYVTLDGRPGGVGSSISVPNTTNLSIINTNTGVNSVAILMRNDASNNTVTYCDLQGQNTTNTSATQCGVVYIGSTTGSFGNDNNAITNCNIHATAGGRPTIGLYSSGTTTNAFTYNDNNTVSNCNIYDYFSASAATTGMKLENGCNAWTITNNRFFQTVSSAYTTTQTNRALWVTPNIALGAGFTITGNFIGGASPAFTGVYTMTATVTSNFFGMDISVGTGAVTSIQNNTISNISLTTTSTSATAFVGISTAAGNIDIGTVTPNIVGSSSATGVITVTSSGNGSGTWGIRVSGGNTVNVANNIVGGITAASSNVANSANLSGIGNGGGSVVSITNNTIINLMAGLTTSTVNGGQVMGINLATALTSPVVNNNIIHDLSNNHPNVGTSTSAGIIGISINTTSTVTSTINGNQIYNLLFTGPSTSVSFAPYIFGILLNGSTTGVHVIAKNNIHSFDLPGWSPAGTPTGAPQFCGIAVNSGAVNIMNNFVRLGVNGAGADITKSVRFIGINKNCAQVCNIWHNSVFIGGTNVVTTNVAATTLYSAAFQRTTNAADEVRNNIFVNVRSNASSSSTELNYAVKLNAVTTLTMDYNAYQAAGTGSLFANNGAADVPAYNSGWLASDTHSWYVDPKFVNPTGTSVTGDLHIQPAAATPVEAQGVAIASVTDDIDGQTRATSTPTDIGADAGNFVAIAACTAPAAPTALVMTPSPTQISGSFTASAGGANGYMVVKYPTGATAVAPSAGANYNVGSILGTGTVIATGTSTSFLSTGLLPSTTYDYYIYAYNNMCSGGPLYSTTLNISQATTPCGGPAGVVSVGPTGTYPTLAAAFTSFVSTGISSAVTLELQSTYTGEATPIVINQNVCFTPANTVTIRPAAGANGLVITGANSGPSIDFNGVNYVTIDGRPGGTGTTMSVTAAGTNNATNLNIINTNTGGVAIRLDNQASNNTIKYCDLQGVNNASGSLPASMAGVVYVGNVAGANGNDNITIDHCNIHSNSATVFPTIGIYSMGISKGSATITAEFNDNGAVTNNNVYDFFSAGSVAAGVEFNFGNNGWTISGNSVFQTSTRTFTAAGTLRALWVNPSNSSNAGNGFIVSGNFFGGSAPLCGGTALTTTAGAFGYLIEPMKFEVVDGAVVAPSSIQGNTITNYSITSTNTSVSDAFRVLWASGTGNLNIGTVTGNVIGTVTGTGGASTGGITINYGTAGCNNHMIIIANGTSGVKPVVNIKKNTINNIVLTSPGGNLSGIFVKDYGTFVIDSNTIGSVTDANSIWTTSTSATAAFLYGINLPTPSTAGNSLTATITNNTIANLTSNSTGTTAVANVTGIAVAQGATAPTAVGVSSISGNMIYNLTNSAPNANTGASSAVIGICMNSTAGVATLISANTIYGLTSTAATANINMEGIFVNGSTAVVSRNLVHSFDAATTGTTAVMAGIDVSGGTVTVANNMIRLGVRSDASDLTTTIGIRGIRKTTSNSGSIIFNSVYIGGGNVGTSAVNTFAFQKTATGVDVVKNNIFANVRSNGTTGGVHYAVSLNNATTLSLNNNIYRYIGTGGVFASNNGVDVPAYSPGWLSGDVNSYNADPSFANPGGSYQSVDLHLQAVPTPAESGGVNIAGITSDFDNDIRQGNPGYASSGTSPDIGADEFNGTSPAPTVTNVTITPTGNQCVAVARNVSADVAPATFSSPIVSVVISYSVNGVAQTDIPMSGGNPFSLSTWTGTIPVPTPSNATVVWSVTATDGTYFKSSANITYADEPLTGVSVVASASPTNVCAGSSTTLSAFFLNMVTSTLGTGTTLNVTNSGGDLANAYPTYYGNGRQQYLVLASELTAAGLAAGTINSIAFNINGSVGSPATLNGYTISIGATGATSITSFQSPAFTTVWGPTNYTPTVSSLNTHTFTTPYVWDGVSNLIINICFNNGITGSSAYQNYQTATAFSSAVYYEADGAVTACTASATGSGSKRPNMIFTGNIAPSVANISWSNGIGVVGTTNPLAVSPSVGTTYTATLSDANGCSAVSSPIPVTVTPVPSAPAVTNSTQCGPGTPSASVLSTAGPAGTGTFYWYDAATLGTVLQGPASGPYSSYYNNDFSSATLTNSAISGTATITGGVINLTTNALSQQGGLTVNASGVNSDFYKVEFDMLISTTGTNLADGMSYSFGDDANASTTLPPAEHGSGSKFKVGFDTYDAINGNNGAGIWLMYNTTETTTFATTTSGVLAYSPDITWVPTTATTINSHVVITINALGQATVVLNGATIFNNIQLPAAYVAANKSTWKHVFAARTGGIAGQYGMDNLNIQTASAVPGYTTYQSSINNTTTFYVSEGGTGVCPSPRAAVTATVNNVTALASNGATGSNVQGAGSTMNYADASCNLIGTISSGATNLGAVSSTETIDASIQTYNNQPYLQRHSMFTPATNGAAIVTLYALQSEFTAYNAVATAYPLMPVTGNNTDPNKANIRVTKFTTANPSGVGVLLIPTSVNWNATNNWWEITVAAPSVGSFFIHTGTIGPLEIKLVDISGVNYGKRNRVDWTTEEELTGDKFVVQRSIDGTNFTDLGTVNANGKASTYHYWDEQPVNGVNHYRLKMLDARGAATFSKTIDLVVTEKGSYTIEAYPNPAQDVVTVKTYGIASDNAQIILTDVTGKMIRTMSVTKNTATMDVHDIAPGVYLLKYADGDHTQTFKINKQ